LHGAPISLTNWQELQAPVPGTSTPAYERVVARVRDEARPMPADPSQRLDAAELAILDNWVAAGAPAEPEASCETTPPDDGNGNGNGNNPPVMPAPGTEDCVEFRSHGAQVPGDESAFQVTNGERYMCFYFDAPWDQDMYGVRFEHIPDNEAVVHHWLLYEQLSPKADGSYETCLGTHPDAVLLAGWAPGREDLAMPENVGLELPPPTGRYLLEVHYYNPSGTAADRSGVRVCATDQPREHTASITWLGSEGIVLLPNSSGQASGTCNPSRAGLASDEPIHILRSWPHMHRHGRHMRTVINRAGGGNEVLIDQDFSFDFQASYETPAIIHPGDTLSTTCTFMNTSNGLVTFGPATADEMCYNFVYAYPARALDRPGSLVGAQNTCL
jgi:hypothetical protein